MDVFLTKRAMRNWHGPNTLKYGKVLLSADMYHVKRRAGFMFITIQTCHGQMKICNWYIQINRWWSNLHGDGKHKFWW
jgi:hypothetical protein